MSTIEKTALNTALGKAFESSFSQTAFMIPMEAEASQIPENEEWTRVQLDFSGPLNGTMAMALSTGLLVTLAQNILGEEETPDEEEQVDALGEMLNIICGVALPELEDTDDVFVISPPRAGEYAKDSGENCCELYFEIDDGYAKVYAHLD